MGKGRFFFVVLASFLVVTAFLVGYEVKPAPGTEPGVGFVGAAPQPASVRQMIAEARPPSFVPRPERVEARGERRSPAADPMFSFGDVFQLVNDKYVNELDNEDREKLAYGAIKGMLRALEDPYTRFMEPKDYSDFQDESRGEFDGIGALLGIDAETELITIVATFEDNPAHDAGLQPGDYIVGIDGESTEDMPLDAAVSKIRGQAGTSVTLTILRPEKVEPLEQELKVTPQGEVVIPAAALQKARMKPDDALMLHVDGSRVMLSPKQHVENNDKPTEDIKVTRATVKIPVVQKRMLPGQIGYVWLQVFNEMSEQQLDEALAELQKKGMRGFVLDLRYDPGGLLDVAVIVASKFIRRGPIVFVQGRRQEEPEKLEALPQEYKNLQVPLVVLVNKFSASASEIVAGAIQDYGTGKIIGVNTFGKGLVQTVIPLNDRSAVAISTAKYLTPKKREIKLKEGIEPDIKVEAPEGFQPSAKNQGEDTQLQAAIQEIERQLSRTAQGRPARRNADGS